MYFFSHKDVAQTVFLTYLCTRFKSNGEIAQLVRASDS